MVTTAGLHHHRKHYSRIHMQQVHTVSHLWNTERRVGFVTVQLYSMMVLVCFSLC